MDDQDRITTELLARLGTQLPSYVWTCEPLTIGGVLSHRLECFDLGAQVIELAPTQAWLPWELRGALLNNPDAVRVEIVGVRTVRYHAPCRPGWTALPLIRWKRHDTRMVEVKWIAHWDADLGD